MPMCLLTRTNKNIDVGAETDLIANTDADADRDRTQT